MADAWVLVADRSRARLFTLSGGRLEEISDFVNIEARVPGHELEHASPARVHDRFGESRHALQSRTLPRDKLAARFADTLKSVLERGRTHHDFRHLVLIAPPRFLGTLNAACSGELGELVVLRVAKNLTHRKSEIIRAELPRALLKPVTVVAGRIGGPTG